MKRQTAYHFFLKHAGYSYGPNETPMQGRIRCAQALARAEREAQARDVTFDIEQDDITNRDYTDEGDEYPLLSCVARDASGNVFASLGGIDIGNWQYMSGHAVANHPYLRVIKAELACELSEVDVQPSEN